MAVMVRSDYEVTTKVRHPDGTIRALGTWISEGQTPEIDEEPGMDDEGLTTRVVHLQRPSPDGSWLATLRAPGTTLQLTPFASGGFDGGREVHAISIEGVRGRVLQFRWLTDGKGVVLIGDQNLWIAGLAREGRGFRTGSVRATPIFAGDGQQPTDMRVLPGGLIVRTLEEVDMNPYPYEEGDPDFDEDEALDWWTEPWHQGRLWRVPVSVSAEGVPSAARPIDLTPERFDVRSATVLAGGRIAMALDVGMTEAEWEELAERGDSEPVPEIRVLAAGATGPGDIVERIPCGEDDGLCYASNWVPGAQHPIYSTPNDQIVVGRGRGTEPLRIDLEEEWYGMVTGLWVSPDGRFVAASNPTRVALFTREGERLWLWDLEEEPLLEGGMHEVHSIHFQPDGNSLLVGAGDLLMEVSEGKAKALATGLHGRRIRRVQAERERRQRLALAGEGEGEGEGLDAEIYAESTTFVDNVLPLGGGLIAYSVVTLRVTEEYDGGIEFPELMEDEIDGMLLGAGPTADPTADPAASGVLGAKPIPTPPSPVQDVLKGSAPSKDFAP